MQTKSGIINEVRKSILKYDMVRAGDRIIVAVSGGPDSICLMDMLTGLSKELDIGLVIAHYDHGLRPEEDAEETALVKKYANSLALPFETEKASGLNSITSSVEEKARELRYEFLEKIRKKYIADKIAMGHNLNDQAETVLMRLMRGSGMTGLSGIPPVRDNTVIRPLIEIRREDIIEYLESKKLEYAIDSSNNDTGFLRNKIRMELLPEMLDYQPELLEILVRLADNLRDENSFLESQAERWLDERLEQDESGDYWIDIKGLKELAGAFIKRILRNIVRKHYKSLYAVGYNHIQAITELVTNEKPNVHINLPNGLIVTREYNRLIFSSRIREPGIFNYEVKEKGDWHIQETGKMLMIEEFINDHQDIITSDANTAFLDMELLPFPLTIRNIMPGDKFVPFGMTGHKKVKDLFIDLKVPPVIRKQTPVLLKDDNIVWICGYRIDDRYKITPRTKKILKITLT
jgi:tRNA(Ile)-lysidine synthase